MPLARPKVESGNTVKLQLELYGGVQPDLYEMLGFGVMI
jgi:hypothetical protein